MVSEVLTTSFIFSIASNRNVSNKTIYQSFIIFGSSAEKAKKKTNEKQPTILA